MTILCYVRNNYNYAMIKMTIKLEITKIVLEMIMIVRNYYHYVRH